MQSPRLIALLASVMLSALMCSKMLMAQELEPTGVPAATVVLPDLWTYCTGAPSQTVTIQQLAENGKPTLWFSPNEPSLTLGEDRLGHWPDAAKQSMAHRGLVYWRIRLVQYRDLKAFNQVIQNYSSKMQKLCLSNDPECLASVEWKDEELARAVNKIVVRYMFYYGRDDGHPHDLESAEYSIDLLNDVDTYQSVGAGARQIEGSAIRQTLALEVKEPMKRCAVARIHKIYGSAHGIGFYTNTLDVDRALKNRKEVPKSGVVILVEEGKHASAPDWNEDGYYTPGFDVNQNVSDAWGIRDSFGLGVVATTFRSETYKVRPATAKVNAAQYDLVRPTEDPEICGSGDEKTRHTNMEKFAKTVFMNHKDGWKRGMPKPYDLMQSKGFCKDVRLEGLGTIKDFGEKIGFGGVYNGSLLSKLRSGL